MDKMILRTLMVFALCGTGYGVNSSISWIPGTTEIQITRTPANPTTNDRIDFTLPTEVFRNHWIAEQSLGGRPTLAIDPVARRIELQFVPSEPPNPVPSDYDPVSGLQGYFGPLDQGSWLFFVQFQGLVYVDPFSVTPATEPPPTSQHFAEQFTSGADAFDLANTSILFTPTDDGTSYTAQAERILVLPVDPANGETLTLGDDDAVVRDLAGSARVSLYGHSFSRIYIGSNGYITFDQGNEDYSESLTNHFKILRISGLFRDLDPSSRGRVSLKRMSDRAVVTWEDIPEYHTDNSNTFQVAMFYDGSIQLSWRRIDSVRGLVGLSDGLGVPPDFQETDFSALLTQPPPPPPPPPPQTLAHPAELFTSGTDAFDLAFASVTFTPNQAGTAYGVKIQNITQLPTDPTGGTGLALTDDSFAFVKLASQARVSLYGSSFTSFYVGSNGYITFAAGDDNYSESLAAHFSALRISGLFRDLSPSSSSQVRWRQLTDRAAVTWVDVPEYGTSNSNTFQIEMFFDGRIRVSWLGIDAKGGIVGLSDGKGLPAGFQETDFSALSGGPPPPPPPPAVDYLTEEFSSNTDVFDLANKSVTFTPTEDGSSYTGSLQSITQLPTSPTGGTNLGLTDDSYAEVGLGSQPRVKIFNQTFGRIFVGSNGYITFTQGDFDYSPTLADHFDMLRISGLFTDLNPTAGGNVTLRQLTNRLVVTWQGVPEYGSTSGNTFQIEMFYDGRIRISWLGIASRNNLVGLSNGLGLPAEFAETDFSVDYAAPSVVTPAETPAEL